MTDASIVLGIDGRPAEQGAKVVKESLTGVKNAAKDTTKAVNENNGAFDRLKGTVGGLRGVFAGLVASFGVRELIRYSDTWKSLEGRLSIAAKSMAELRGAQQKLFEISQNTRTSLEATTGLYIKLEQSSKNLGRTTNELLRFTELINKSFIISGASSAETAGAVRQLSQALASGVLRGDEFNSIMENAPRVQQALASSLGVSIGKLRQMAETGQLTSKSVVDALLKQGIAIDREFSKIPTTIGQALTQLDNAFLKFIGNSNAIATGSSSIAAAITSLANNFDLLAKGVLALGAAYTISVIPAIYATTKAFIASEIVTIRAIFNAKALAAANLYMGETAAAASVSLGVLRTALIALPLLAVGLLLTDLITTTKNIDAANLRYGESLDTVNQFQAEFITASAQRREAMIEDTKRIITGHKAELESLKSLIVGYQEMSPLRLGFEEVANRLRTVLPGVDDRDAPSDVAAKAIRLNETIKAMEKTLTSFEDGSAAKLGGGNDPAAGIKKKESALAKYNDKLKETLALAKADSAASLKSEKERAIAKALIEAETAAREDLGKGLRKTAQLRPGEIEFIKQTSAATFDLTERIKKEDEARGRIKDLLESTRTPAEKLNFELDRLAKDKAFARTPAELEAINREMSRLRDEVNPLAEIFKNTAESIRDNFRSAIRGMLDGNGGFRDIKTKIVGLFKDMLADMLALRLANPIIIPIVTALGGALGLGSSAIGAVTAQLGGSAAGAAGSAGLASGGASALSGILNGFNTPLLNTGQVVGLANFLGFGNNTAATGTLLSGVKGLTPAAGIAGFAGNFLANSIFGNRGIGATIGGSLGGLAGGFAGGAALGGTLGSAAGPLGALAGSVIGNVLGGLFGGGKPSSKLQTGVVDLNTGAVVERTGLTGKKFSQENYDAVTSLSQVVAQLATAINGGTPINNRLNIQVGARNGYQYNFGPGESSNSFGDIPSFLKSITADLVGIAPKVSESVKTALANIDFSTAKDNFQGILDDINFAFNFDKIGQKIDDVAEYKTALDTLNKQFDEYAATARRLGLEEEKVNRIRNEQITALRTQFNTDIRGQLLSITNPAQLQLEQLEAEYKKNRANATAIGGDFYSVDTLYLTKKKAITDEIVRQQAQAELEARQQELQGQQDAIRANIAIYEEQANAAQNALQEWKRLSESLDDYANKILLNGQLSPLAPEQRVGEANRQFDNILAKALGGDKEAFNEFTGISDELLQISKEYFGATQPYFDTFEKVKTGIQAAKAVADQQVNIASAMLQNSQQQLSILQGQQNTFNSMLAQLQAIAQKSGASTTPTPVTPSGVLSTPPATTPYTDAINAALLASFSTFQESYGSGRGQVSDYLVQNPQYIPEYNARRSQYQGQSGFSTSVAASAQQAGLFFNEQKYLQAYPDVAQAVANHIYSSGLQHYLSIGYTQQRRAFTYAQGGLAQGWSLVGEEGPELVNFQNPTMVYPNEATRSLLGSNDNTEVVGELKALRETFNQYRLQSAAETNAMRADLQKANQEMEETRVMLTRTATGPR